MSKAVVSEEAGKILEEMYALNIPAPDGKLFWGYNSAYNFALVFSDYDLYNGFTGMAVFASACAYVRGGERALKIADYLVNAAADSINEMCQRLRSDENPIIPVGEGGGLGGVLTGLALIKRYLPYKTEKLDALCREILEILGKTDFKNCNKSDRVGGIAGLISVLCRFDEYRGCKEIVRAAADRLLEMKDFEYHGYVLWQTLSDTPRILSGAGHGMAGIAEALYAAAELLGDNKYISAAEEALDYEMKLYEKYSEKIKSWADLRDFPPTKYMHGYCGGAPGIGIMLQRIGNAGGEITKTLARLAREKIDTLPLNALDHLCCANSAIVEYYLTIGDYSATGDVLASMYERRQDEGCYRYSPYNTNNSVTAALFYGMSGIGYEMLRYAFPDKIISIL